MLQHAIMHASKVLIGLHIGEAVTASISIVSPNQRLSIILPFVVNEQLGNN
jgi:hypothetical protein